MIIYINKLPHRSFTKIFGDYNRGCKDIGIELKIDKDLHR